MNKKELYILTSRQIRIFIQDIDGRIELKSTISPFRLFTEKDKARVILRSRVFFEGNGKFEIPVLNIGNGSKIMLVTGLCGNPVEYKKEDIWISLYYCQRSRYWLGNIGALYSNEDEVAVAWAEFISTEWEIRTTGGEES